MDGTDGNRVQAGQSHASFAAVRAPWRLLVAASAFLATTVLVAPAASRLVTAFADVDPLPPAALSMMRGGFTVAGIDLNFGAHVQTFVDGRLALETRLVPDAAGRWQPVPDAELAGAAGQGLTVIESRTLGNLAATGVVATDGLPADLRSVVEDGGGIVLESRSGLTAVLHRLPSGVPANLVISSASGRSISQSTAITIGIGNFDTVVESVSRDRFAQIGRLSGRPELIQSLP